MANKNVGEAKVKVTFQSDKSSVNDLKKSLQQVQNQAKNIKVGNKMYEDFQKASKAAKELESILNKSWNDKLGQLNLDKFNQSIKSSYGNVEKLKSELSGAGTAGQTAFNAMASQVLNTNMQLRQSNKLLDSMATSMANTVKWGITSAIFNNITGSIQKAYYYAKDLDTSLNNIRIVTGDSADQMDRFAKTANTAAKELGKSTLDYTKAALSFYQQGLDEEEVTARTNVTMKAQNITGAGSEMADYLTSVWNGFKVSAEDTEGVVDKLAKVADSSASNMSELAIAMSKVAATANVMGVDVDQLTAQLATVIATTRQAPESVGTAFKTIYTRLNDIKVGADEAEISLGNYSGKMAELGFNVLDANGQLRDTGQVIEQIGGHWDTLTKAQQVYLAQTMGGQRQVTQLIALFDNWGKYSDLLNTSLEAQGTLNQKNDVYLESVAAHLEQLRAETERTYQILFDANAVKGFTDVFNSALTQFNNFIAGIGGGINVFVNFGSVVANIFNKQIASAINNQIKSLESWKSNLNAIEAKQNIIQQVKLDHQAKGEDLSTPALEKQATIAEKTLAVRKALTSQQYNEITNLQRQIGLDEQRIQEIQSYTQYLQQNNLSEQTSIDTLERIKASRQESIDAQKQMLTYLELCNASDEDIAKNKELIRNLSQQIADADSNIAYQLSSMNQEQAAIFEKVQDGYFEQNEVKELLQRQRQLLQEQEQEQQNLIRAINNKRDAENGTLDVLKSQNAARENIISQQQKSAQRALSIQSIVRGVTSLTQGLSSVLGGVSVNLDKSSTAAEKLQGRFSMVSGGLSAIANYFLPGSGILVQGLASIVKQVLKLGGIWDSFEQGIKSTAEKIEDFNNKIKQINQNDKIANQNIDSLKDVEKEWQRLSILAGDYGQNLESMTETDQNRYHEIADSFAEFNEAVIVGYDEQGHAIVRGQEALKDTIQVLKQAKREADAASLGSKEKVFSGIALKHEKDTETPAIQDAKIQLDNSKAALDSAEAMKLQYENGLNNIISDLQLFTTSFNNALDREFGEFVSEDRINFNESVVNVKGTFMKLYDAYDLYIQELNKYQQTGDQAVLNKVISIGQTLSKAVEEQTNQDLSTFDIVFNQYNEEVYNKLSQELNKKQQIYDSLVKQAQQAQNYTNEDAAAFLKALYSFSPDVWDNLEQTIKNLNIDNNILQNLLTEYITSFTDETPEEQVYAALEDYAIHLNKALSSGYFLIDQAIKSASFSNFEGTYKEWEDSLQNQIQNIIDSLDLKHANTKIKNIWIDVLKDAFDLSELKINADGKIIKDSLQIKETLINDILTFTDDDIPKSSIQSFKEKLKTLTKEQLDLIPEVYSSIDIDAIKSSARYGDEVVNAIFGALLDSIENVNTQEISNSIIEKFDKITSAFSKLQSGKSLNYTERGNLITALGLNDEELQSLDTKADWLDKIVTRVFETLNQNSLDENVINQRRVAIETFFTSIQELNDALGKGLITQAQVDDTWTTVFQNEAAAAQVTTQQLKLYAEAKGLAFDETNQESLQAALSAYKLDKNLQDVSSTVEKLQKNAEDGIDLKVKNLDDLLTLADLLSKITGTHWGVDDVIAKLDAIGAAAANNTGSVQEFLKAIKGYSGQDVEGPKTATETYTQDKERLTTLKQSSDALKDQKALTEEQSKALSDLVDKNNVLKQIQQEKGLNSQEFLNTLNQILQKEQAITEAERQTAIATEQARQKVLEGQIQDNQSKLIGLPTDDQIEQAQAKLNALMAEEDKSKFLPEGVQLEEFIKSLEEIISKEEERTAILTQLKTLQQQLNASKAAELQLESDVAAKSERSLDADVNKDNWQDLTKYLSDYADQLDEVSDSLKDNQEASGDLAEAILRYDAALASVIKNYSKWEKQLSSGTIQDAVQAGNELQNVYADLLDLPFESLSPDFTQNVDNLQLLQQAANGSIQAYQELQELAGQDILVQLGIDTNQFYSDRDEIYNAINEITGTSFDDIEIGADLNNQAVLDAMSEIINAAGMTADQATDYLASMGVDATVEKQPVQEQSNQQLVDLIAHPHIDTVPTGSLAATPLGPVLTQAGSVQLGSVEYEARMHAVPSTTTKEATALKVTSAKKSSGGNFKFNNASHGGGASAPKSSGGGKKGGGGKGKSPKTTTTKAGTKQTKLKKDDQIDKYHDINIELAKINNQFTKLNREQKKLVGKDLIKSLKEQLILLDKQIAKQKEKQAIQAKELEELQTKLSKKGVTFNEEGDISNYTKSLETALKEYNSYLSKYNKMTDKQQKANKKKLEKRKQTYEDFKDLIERYDTLHSEQIPELEEEIQEELNKKIEIQIDTFKMKIQAQLDLKQAERDWNQFKKKVIDQVRDDDILKQNESFIADFGTYYDEAGRGTIQTQIQYLKDLKDQYDAINKNNTSSIYGDNKAQLIEDMQQGMSDIMSNMGNIEDLINSIKQSIFTTINATQTAIDKQVDNFNALSDIIQHDVNLVKLIYGEQAYESLGEYYKQQEESNNKQLEFLQQEKTMWYNLMTAEQDAMKNITDKNSNEWKEANERLEAYQERWKAAVKDINSLVENSIQNLITKYTNSINQVFYELNKELTSGKSLNYIGEEWQLINKQADIYLDKVNSMYQIDKLQNTYKQVINDNTGNLKAQRALNNLMQQQLAYLRSKDKLSQYDVDRANMLLQIETKRLALEESRQNKSKLRLRRDSQGNYSYEFVENKEQLVTLRQEISDLSNDLYNLTQKAYKDNLDSLYGTVQEWEEKVKQVYLDTTLTTEQQTEKINLYNKYYGDIINARTKDNKELRIFLMQDMFTAMSRMYNVDTQKYEDMTKEQRQITWEGIKDFAEAYGVNVQNFDDMTEQQKKRLISLIGEFEKQYGLNTTNFKNMTKEQKEEFIDKFVPQWKSGVQTMSNVFNKQGGFLPTTQASFKKLEIITKSYEASLKQLQTSAGINFKNIKKNIDADKNATERLTSATGELIDTLSNNLTKVKNYIGQIDDLTKAYDNTKQAAINAATAIRDVIKAEQEKAAYDGTGGTGGGDAQPKTKEQLEQEHAQRLNAYNNAYKTLAGLEKQLAEARKYSDKKLKGKKQADYIVNTINPLEEQVNIARNNTDTAQDALYSIIQQILDIDPNWLSINGQNPMFYDTGGYTGSWGSQGKLAVLHEKEQVFNKEDTQNLLNAVKIVRTLSDTLQSINTNTGLSGLLGIFNQNANTNSVDQNVHIEAHFPNATNHLEIEEAFNNLVNRASQYAFNTRR